MVLLLAEPRGFCAGVARAVLIVEAALEKWGAPIYVRHEIVHNEAVVESLKDKGAIFVEELDDIPTQKKERVIFSAHGVAPDIIHQARQKGFEVIDATCPLVLKVHAEVIAHQKAGRHVFLIGHKNHPEMIGTIGHIIDKGATLIETKQDALKASLPKADMACAFATQTTLSVFETTHIIAILKERFPQIISPPSADICYATTNRQKAVAQIAPQCDMMLILGSDNSSNAQRLVETANIYGAKEARLIPSLKALHKRDFVDKRKIGLSAGASTPESLVKNVIAFLDEAFDLKRQIISIGKEDVVFKIPKALNRAG